MHCPKCGRELQDNWVKCPYCNTDILKAPEERTPDEKHREKEGEVQNNYLFLIWKKVKKILKIVIYIFVVLLLLIGPLTSSGMGTTTDSFIEVASYYSYILFLVIIPLALILNFKGIRNRLPLFKKHRIGTTLIASVLTYFSICIILVGTTILSDSLYSQDYKDEKRIQQIAEEEARIVAAEQEAAEKAAAEQEAAEKAAAEQEAAEKAAAEQKAAEKAAAEQEAAEKAAAEKEAAEKAETEKEATENTSGEKEKTDQQTVDIEEYSSYPYLSKEYLIYSLDQMGISFPLYPQEIVVQNYLDNCDNISGQNVDVLGIFSSYYGIVDEQTEYIYFGETKNGRPEGLGVIKERMINVSDDPKDVDIRDYSIMYNGVECYATIYAGYFQDGRYNGFGMLYKTPVDEEYMNNAIYLDDFYQNIEGLDLEKNLAKTINPLVYIGDFSDGKYGDAGYEFYYTALNNADNSEELNKIKENSIIVFPYKKGEESDLIFPKGNITTFEIEDILNYSYGDHLT